VLLRKAEVKYREDREDDEDPGFRLGPPFCRTICRSSSTKPVRSMAAPTMNMKLTVRMAEFAKIPPRMPIPRGLIGGNQDGVAVKGHHEEKEERQERNHVRGNFSQMKRPTVTRTRRMTKIWARGHRRSGSMP